MSGHRGAKYPAVPGTRFLPVNRRDMDDRGWDELDFLLITGDAYVDHPSFGAAVISRVLEAGGYRVGILPQPDWRSRDPFMSMGRPRHAVLVTAGNLDSMLNKLTASKKSRSTDVYSPGGRAGMRPDRATIVYCSRVRECWRDVPIVIGGVEASLRRFAHYDYWSDEVRRSILYDSQADLLVYGMGELQVRAVADGLACGTPVGSLRGIPGTVFMTRDQGDLPEGSVFAPSFEEVSCDKRSFAEAFVIQDGEQDPFRGRPVVQPHGTAWMVQNPPAHPLSEAEMDEVYSLPYARTYHPAYEDAGGVPAISEVRFSLTSHRGCFGGCSFCAIHYHQGRIIQSRSHESIIREARILTELPDFKGYIHDVGGPTANFTIPACEGQLVRGSCRDRQCLFPKPCPRLRVDHSGYLRLLRELRSLPKVKKVFIRSGIRYDYLMADKKSGFLRELCLHHVSGQLKVAPEHVSDRVLALMRKPVRSVYDEFREAYASVNEELGKKQYLVPYFISSHPGATLDDAVELAEYLRDTRSRPEQAQDFIPTPGSLSTCMYHTGLNPFTGEAVTSSRTREERDMQRALLRFSDEANREAVIRALKKAGRDDLIGRGPSCLVRREEASAGGRRGAQGGKKAPRARGGGRR
ncbi:MAG: YgiQ family radical SAM protein [Synergistota bacterium]|nr:YgiQ family radical SAM protein [Synergistota bacterium]